MNRPATVQAFPELTGFAPPDMAWCAYDTSSYDGAPDAGPQIIGWGATEEAALKDYDRALEEFGA